MPFEERTPRNHIKAEFPPVFILTFKAAKCKENVTSAHSIEMYFLVSSISRMSQNQDFFGTIFVAAAGETFLQQSEALNKNIA